MNVYSFEMEAAFGLFQWDKTKGDNRITNFFPSKTEVLGILGSIIGLDGYSQEQFRALYKSEKRDTFYQVLKGLEVSVLPIHFPTVYEDQLIHQHMDNINKRGGLMVNIIGLVNPKFKIFIRQGKVDSEVFDKLVTYLRFGWSEFIPYCGKNNFPLEITNFKEETLVENQSEENRINSLFLLDTLESDLEDLETDVEENEFLFLESSKLFDDESEWPQMVNKNMVWTSYEVELEEDIYTTTGGENIVFY